MHNIDSARMPLIKMANIKRDSWELLLRKQISAGFVESGELMENNLVEKIIYVFDEEIEEKNLGTTSTLNIPWER